MHMESIAGSKVFIVATCDSSTLMEHYFACCRMSIRSTEYNRLYIASRVDSVQREVAMD